MLIVFSSSLPRSRPLEAENERQRHVRMASLPPALSGALPDTTLPDGVPILATPGTTVRGHPPMLPYGVQPKLASCLHSSPHLTQEFNPIKHTLPTFSAAWSTSPVPSLRSPLSPARRHLNQMART
jgi:hypothetical protein